VLKKLRIEFQSIDDAEASYGITYYNDVSSQVHDDETVLPGEVMNYVTTNFGKLSNVQRMELLTCQLRMLIEMDYSKDLTYFVPRDLLPLLLSGMRHLHQKEKDNVIYNLCKCLGQMKQDGSSARLNVDKMPFGLLAYNCKFFASDDASNLRASENYKKWMESMYSYFGNTWASLFLGPMWSYDEEEKGTAAPCADILSEAFVKAFGELAIPDVNNDSDIHPLALTPTINVPAASAAESPSTNPVGNGAVSPAEDQPSARSPTASAAPACGVETSTPCVTPRSSSTAVSPGEHDDQSGHMHNVSTLWSGLSQSEREELAESEVHPRDIAAMHQITPSGSRSQRSYERKTMNVSFYVEFVLGIEQFFV